ncbi:MAG: hypothetical protein ACUZ8O_14340 [Candidatus Anammoxibacter sp.]
MAGEAQVLGNIELDRIRFTLENLGWKIVSVDLNEDTGRLKFTASKSVDKPVTAPDNGEVRL